MTAGRRTAAEPIGIGYQGRALPELVEKLVADGVQRLIDVRLTPISRKRGFSKTALCHALAEAGIVYEHRPELGNPKMNRIGFGGSASDVARARAVFSQLIRQPAASQAIEGLAERAAHERLAVLCFEADQSRCHRDIVLTELTGRIHRSG